MTGKTSSIRNICVYCGSQPGKNPAHLLAATQLGHHIAEAGLGLVYGGGDRGLMGAVAKGCIAAGGPVKGIIPEFLLQSEQENNADGLDQAEMIVVPDMHTRKSIMFEEADAFIALPGGIGTLEELVEIMTWAQLARHTKPMAILNVEDFWTPLIELIQHMTDEGFLHNPERTGLIVDSDAKSLVQKIKAA